MHAPVLHRHFHDSMQSSSACNDRQCLWGLSCCVSISWKHVACHVITFSLAGSLLVTADRDGGIGQGPGVLTYRARQVAVGK